MKTEVEPHLWDLHLPCRLRSLNAHDLAGGFIPADRDARHVPLCAVRVYAPGRDDRLRDSFPAWDQARDGFFQPGIRADELSPVLLEILEDDVPRFYSHGNILIEIYLVAFAAVRRLFAAACTTPDDAEGEGKPSHRAQFKSTLRHYGCDSMPAIGRRQEKLRENQTSLWRHLGLGQDGGFGCTNVKRRADNRSFWQIYTLPNVWNEIRLWLSRRRDRTKIPGHDSVAADNYDDSHAREVGRFYDAHHDAFLQVYGDVIQAFRTREIVDLLNYQIKSIGFLPGQRVLDAGCGLGVPAIHFARHTQVLVDAITISRLQYEAALEKIATANLSDRVTVIHGDYHDLAKYFEAQAYDVVYFLESFGHSKAKRRLIKACWEVLKPGGTLYIKDLFRRIPLRPEHKERIDGEIGKINAAYRYDVAELNTVLSDLRGEGFILILLKTIDFSLEQFEDLAISNQFQELTGLARIENWEEYVFPVEFFEIKCMKPEFSLDERLDRYFLQHRLHRSLEGQADR